MKQSLTIITQSFCMCLSLCQTVELVPKTEVISLHWCVEHVKLGLHRLRGTSQ